MYTETIGEWSYFIIATAAFSIMFGTSIAVFDGYSRALTRCVELVRAKRTNPSSADKYQDEKFEIKTSNKTYYISLLIIGIGSFLIIWQFLGDLKKLVDLATTISFLISPVIAIVNFRLVSKKYLNKEDIPPLWMQILSLSLIHI